MRIGLFGGSFNPVTNGHINCAEGFKKVLQLNKVVFIPVYNAAHKELEDDPGNSLRFTMVQEAIKNKAGLTVSNIEAELDGLSYTLNTVKYFRELHPDDELFLLIGADSALDFPDWYRYNEILDYVTLSVWGREGYSMDEAKSLLDRLDIKAQYVEEGRFAISSTMVRDAIKAGADFKNLVPDNVYETISSKNLYC